MQSPFFSIIIPTYNRWHLLSNAINSILSQSFQDFEIIVCDDGSTDDTPRLFETKFTDSRIHYYYLEHKGVSHTRNIGINHAFGKFIAFLDSDDLYLNDYLEKAFVFLHNKNFPVGLIRSFCVFSNKTQEITLSENKRKLLLGTTLFLPSIICHSSILKQIKFNINYHVAEDYNLWLNILNIYPFFEIPIHSVRVNDTPNSLSKSGGNKKNLEYVKTVLLILKEMKTNKNKLGYWFFKINLANRFSYFINIAYSQNSFQEILTVGFPIIIRYPHIIFHKNNFQTLIAAILKRLIYFKNR